ncbi:cell division protein FtsI/penicillin-binding protein 2 [Weissella koreensis KACC 15510]|uniref:penicillin-binding protein n=1 Tax=Weissella koreensis TaxID=165096 RepID=UPI000217458C|nr:penicillin-binding protein [Weissella koreensis]AEJ23125.1 cell division protein FtsI/penicillin-binding protein 2 [Weissella koreensis KACC 15510]
MLNKGNMKRSHGAIIFMLCILTGVIFYIGSRFFSVAVTHSVDHVNLEQRAQNLYENQDQESVKRGQIYDSIGNVLAENSSVYTAIIVLQKDQPKYLKNSQVNTVSKELAQELGGDASYYKKIIKNGIKHHYFQVQFGSNGVNISQEKYRTIKKKNIPGLIFEAHPARLYPNGQFASDLIGEASSSGSNKIKGVSGIEGSWNKQLTEQSGVSANNIKNGNLSQKTKNVEAKNGYDIYTTLNTKLQSTLEDKMNALQADMQPKQAFAAIVDTKTGDIVAETQRPTYNATTKSGFGNFWSNLLVQEPYEPGSVLKGITLASAIDTNNWNGDNTYSSGKIQVDDKVVKDWNNGDGWGRISYTDGIALSSNVAMVLTEQKMGSKTWGKYLDRFQFLKPTDMGFSSETSGSMNFRYPIEQANTAFGQGIKVTPAQMIQAYSAIAGNGEEIKPNIISKIVDPNTQKVIYSAKRTKVAKPIKESTAKATRKELENVIYNPKGLGAMYAIPNVKTTGKSGTAQISTSAGYTQPGDNTNEIHSWMGMAPSDNPRYMMYIVVKEPQSNTDNIAKDMSNVFVSTMEQALQMNTSDKKAVISDKQQTKIPAVKNESMKKAKSEIEANHLKPEVIGDGKVVKNQYPLGGGKTLLNQRVFIVSGGNVKVPNMQGWSKKDVKNWGRLVDIKINSSGEGFLVEQSVLPDTRIADGIHEITVKFKTP